MNYYATDAIGEMIGACVKFYYVIHGLILYSDRLKTYNAELCGVETMEGIDAMFISFFSFSFLAYGYRFLWGILNASIYYPLGHTDIPLVIHSLVTFIEFVDPDKDGYDF